MRRLIMSIAMLIGVVTIATPAFAQSKDLAGSWVLDAEKSATKDGPPKIVLTLTDKEFTAKFGGDTARLMTFKLDGTETAMAEGAAKTKAVWKGNKLEATVTMPDREPESVTFSRDGLWLMVEVSSHGPGPTKLYFKKDPAK
jgi:hypothetical protein